MPAGEPIVSARSHGRSIVIGLDSADIVLIEHWAAQGYLPFFRDLLAQTAPVRLETDSAVLQGAVWPNILTGRKSGSHGTYMSPQLTTGTYGMDTVRGSLNTLPTFYELMELTGLRCAIVDIPTDRPRAGFAGVHVVDWLSEFQYQGFEASPSAFKADLLNRYGLISPRGGYGPTPNHKKGHRQLRGKLRRSLEAKTDLTRRLLARTDLDCIFVVFAEAHKAGHFFWRYFDPQHFDHDGSDPELCGALREVYVALDTALAGLVQALRPSDHLLLFSDHGMQANNRGDHFVSTILARLGLCAKGSQDRLGGDTRYSKVARVEAVLRAIVRRSARLLPERCTSFLRARFGAASRVDWGKTTVFSLSTDRNTYLRLNVTGREPSGIVDPGAEYERVLTLLENEFHALRNADTGQPAVAGIHRPQTLYPGRLAKDLPDLVIVWNAAAPLRCIESPRLGRLHQQPVENRSGNHRPEGFLFARGTAFAQVPRTERGDVMQLTPTLFALHGLTLPGAEADPLHELFAVQPSPVRESSSRAYAAPPELIA